jgi:hypothetical protein
MFRGRTAPVRVAVRIIGDTSPPQAVAVTPPETPSPLTPTPGDTATQLSSPAHPTSSTPGGGARPPVPRPPGSGSQTRPPQQMARPRGNAWVLEAVQLDDGSDSVIAPAAASHRAASHSTPFHHPYVVRGCGLQVVGSRACHHDAGGAPIPAPPQQAMPGRATGHNMVGARLGVQRWLHDNGPAIPPPTPAPLALVAGRGMPPVPQTPICVPAVAGSMRPQSARVARSAVGSGGMAADGVVGHHVPTATADAATGEGVGLGGGGVCRPTRPMSARVRSGPESVVPNSSAPRPGSSLRVCPLLY